MRIGIGHDTHRLGPGGPLTLGGLTIPHDHHAIGHSDADVLLHAIVDALLGALSQGDIGEIFPDTDDQHRRKASKEFLFVARRRVESAGYRIMNLDCIVFAQRPKLSEYKEPMCRQIASWLNIDRADVSIKAKTGESVGPIGREEAIAAEAVVLLERRQDAP